MTERSVLADYIAIYENLGDADLAQLEKLVTSDIRFKDPFNDIQGVEALRRLLRKTLDDIEEPSFKVLGIWHRSDDGTVLLKWRFSGRVPVLKQWQVEGISEIRFNSNGLISGHIDYWDAAEFFYARLPVIGPILRRIGRRLSI